MGFQMTMYATGGSEGCPEGVGRRASRTCI